MLRKLLGLAVSAALIVSPATAAEAPAKRPNIVILLADDWGFTDVGAFGGEMRTPNLDALAKAGVRFSNFHVAGSCSPTRAMLQTGVSNHRAGLGNMPETIPPEHLGKPGYDAELNNRVVTIADLLRAANYRTYFTGKWHLGKTVEKLPTSRGYDRAFALAASGADNFEEKPNLLLYPKADWTEDGKPAHLPKNYYSSRFIVDKMIEYLDSGRTTGKPFFASLNFLANHIPIQAPDADIAAYKGRYDAGWSALRLARRTGAAAQGIVPAGTQMMTMRSTPDWDKLPAAEKWQRARAMEAYGAMATAMDREIGRFVAHLKATGEYENTIFVFLSDNGAEALDPMADGFTRWNANHYYDQRPEQQGRPGSLTAIGPGFASAAVSPLRGYKFTASEGGLRVPLIVAWPGNAKVASGGIARGFAHVIDIMPTLLALSGVPAHPGAFNGRTVERAEGFDLSPMLAGGASARPDDVPLGYELSGNAALFKGNWKLVKNLAPYGDGRWRLYDIANDPGETADLSAQEKDRFEAMQKDYAAFAARDQVLAMPEGYQAPKQIKANAIRELLIPKLLRLLGWVAAGIAALVGLVYLWRRRRKARTA